MSISLHSLRGRYGLAVTLSISAVVLKLVAGAALGESAPFLLLTGSVAISALMGGKGPGLLACAIGAIAVILFFLHPSDGFFSSRSLSMLGAFILEGSIVSWLAGICYNDERTIREQWNELANARRESDRLTLNNQSLHDTIGEQHQAEMRLNLLNMRLQRSNRELEIFAMAASHDLQEPLRKIKAFSELLASGYAGQLGEEGGDYLRRIIATAERMQVLISDLLALARVTSMARPFARVDLDEVARQVTADHEILIRQAGARVEIGSLPVIDAEPVHMQQLFSNLIGNALKFRNADIAPLVTIRSTIVQPDGNREAVESCRIEVQDNGIGFDEQYLQKIFMAFQRLHGRGMYEGSGVGLAICQKIVDHHQGSITARSTPGVGSTFIVTLPTRQPDVASDYAR
jgi:signal transduction histidine kinase